MTPIALPLVMSLVSLGISEARFQPSAEIWKEFSGSRFLPSAESAALKTPGGGSVVALQGSAYPEAYRWNQDEALLAPVDLDGPAVQARVTLNQGGTQVSGTEDDDSPDHDFDLTRGVGLVGVGFVWRYR